MIYTLFVSLIVLAAIFMVLVVLIQESKGGGLASNFSSSNAIMGVRKTTDVVEKATWKDEMVYKGTLEDIESKTSHIKGVALIMLGEFLHQKETLESGLYSKKE